jgi:hypothetical protein
MIGERQFAISALDFLLGGGTRHAEHFIVVTFAVAGQNKPSESFLIVM